MPVLLATLLVACSTSPTAPPAVEEPAPAPAPSPSRPGSYSVAEVNDDARAVAAFAVSALGRPGVTLASVDAVETQVVAGLNSRLDLTLSDGSRWRVVVYRSLDQQLSLTSQESLPAR